MLRFREVGEMPAEYPDNGMPEAEFQGLLGTVDAEATEWDETALVIDGDKDRVLALMREAAEGKHGPDMQMIANNYRLV